MTEILHRDAASTDLPAILEIQHLGAVNPSETARPDPNDKCYREAFNSIQNDPNNRLVVAERQGKIIGTLQITIIPGLARKGQSRGMLESIHVHPDYRGSGIGSKMLVWALEACRKSGCCMVQLTSNKLREDAHRFYARHNFVATHEGFKLMF